MYYMVFGTGTREAATAHAYRINFFCKSLVSGSDRLGKGRGDGGSIDAGVVVCY
jgi:hypothetical protein